MTADRIHLRYWEPRGSTHVDRVISTVDELLREVDVAVRKYRDVGAEWYPGVSLAWGVEDPEDSISIAVAPDGWAIIYTDQHYWQRVTRGGLEPDGTYRNVKFDDYLAIGTSCFIDRHKAIGLVEAWMGGVDVKNWDMFSDDLLSP